MNWSLLAAETDGLIQQELAILLLLTIASGVAILVRRLRFPYTVALVLVGLMLSLFPEPLIGIEFSKDVILAVLVPPLIFEAALHLPFNSLRRNGLIIFFTAIIGTFIGTFIVGSVVATTLDIPFVAAIAFGALISATDPVAVVAFFRTLGVSKRLTVLVEGESLFNDGAAIVIFNIALTTGALMSAGTYEGFNVAEAFGEFLIVSLGGLAIGSLLGGIVSYGILKNVDDALVETSVTLSVAFGSFLLAEYFGAIFGGVFTFLDTSFHFSGILAVVAASLFVGNIGSINTSPTTKVTLDNFWEFLTFVVNSFVFLVIGLKINLLAFRDNLTAIFIAVAVVLASRALLTYGLTWIHGIIRPKEHIPNDYRHVMFWGGLRGAISLALALTLDGSIFGAEVSEQLQVMTFGVVLFTLLVQGLSIERLIKRLGLVTRLPHREEQLRLQALVIAKRAGQEELNKLHREGILANDIHAAMNSVYQRDIDNWQNALAQHLHQFPELEQEILLVARRDTLRSERVAIVEAGRRGLISADLQAQLLAEIDERAEAVKLLQDEH